MHLGSLSSWRSRFSHSRHRPAIKPPAAAIPSSATAIPFPATAIPSSATAIPFPVTAIPSPATATESRATTIESPKPYRYQSLEDPRCVRLIRFTPAPTSSDVKPSLVVISLDDPSLPNYTTLSHAWGRTFEDGSHLSQTLESEQGSISISQSLHAALTRIQEDAYSLACRDLSSGGSRFLWIDSICINQLDTAERSAQVALMPDIYSRCFDMIIWLGEQSSDAVIWEDMFSNVLPSLYDAMIKLHNFRKEVPDRFLENRSDVWPTSVCFGDLAHRRRWDPPGPQAPLAECVQTAYSELQPNERKLADRLLYYPPIQYEEMCSSASFALINHPLRRIATNMDDLWTGYRDAYADLVQADWFTRKWVIQEVAQTDRKRRTCLFTGGRMDMKLLKARLNELSLLDAATPLNATLTRTSGSSHTLLENLVLYRNTHCSIPHDHVYALLGLSRDTDWLDIDYLVDVNELFTSVASHYICAGQDFLTLALATTQRSAQGLPSWVPDWREAWQCDRSVLHENAMAIMSSEERRLWKDARPSPPGLSIEQTYAGFPGLKVKAWILGRCSQSSTASNCPCPTCKLLADVHSCRRDSEAALTQTVAVDPSILGPGRSSQTSRIMHESTGRDRWSKVVLEQFETTMHQEEALCLFPDCALTFVLLPTGQIDETIGYSTYRLEFCFQVDEEHFSTNWFADILDPEEQEWICIV